MAGRRVIYIQNPSSGSHFRVLGNGSGKQPPLNKPPKPPKPPKIPKAPTHHGTTPATSSKHGGGMPQYSPLGGVIGAATLPMTTAVYSSLALGSLENPMGGMLLAAGLLSGYMVTELPGWGQPLSFFSVMTPENGATQGYQGNLMAAWTQIMEGLGTPTEGTIFDDFSLIPTERGGTSGNQSSESYYREVAGRLGITNPPPPNYGGGGDAIRREVWRLTTGQGFTKITEQLRVGTNRGGSLFSP